MTTWQVGASSDDCYRRLTSPFFSLTSTFIAVGSFPAAQIGCGLRFTAINIPQGATITQAYLTLRASLNTSGTIIRSRISAEDVDDAPTFANSAADFDTRWAARTTARVDWDSIPAWSTDVDYDSPEIKTVIQEVVDRALWASGNDIVIFWEDFDNRSDYSSTTWREAYSYDGSATYAPKLTILINKPRFHFQIIG